jgi:hypothetical protein
MAFPRQQRSRERDSIWRPTYTAYLVIYGNVGRNDPEIKGVKHFPNLICSQLDQ